MAVEEAIGDATLQDETLAELGLSAQPFIDSKKSNRFADSTTQAQRAGLEQNLRFGESLHLLIGEKGVGKTVFLSQLIKHCKSTIKPFVAKGADSFETVLFLSAVLKQLSNGDEDAADAESISDHVDALTPLFEDLADDRKSVVLAIDDAHLAPIEEIAELIDIMASFTTENGDQSARLLLAGEPKMKDELTAIADEIDDELSFEHSTTILEPLDESRVTEYLTTQLNQAGHTDAFPFTDKAVTKLHRESRGLPANINSLAGKYLNSVYSGSPAGVGGKGFFAALGWPLLALGAAAMGLIAWGLSMFIGGDKPDGLVTNTPVVIEPVASNQQTDTTVITTDNTTVVTPDPNIVVDNTLNSELTTGSLTTESIEQVGVDATTTLNTTIQGSTVQAEVDLPGQDLLKPADRVVPVTEIAQNIQDNVTETTTNIVTDTTNNVTEQIIAVTPAPTVNSNDTATSNNTQLTTGPIVNPVTVSPVNASRQPADAVTVPNSVQVTIPNTTVSPIGNGVGTGNSASANAADNAPSTNNSGAASNSAIFSEDSSGIPVAIEQLNNNTLRLDNPTAGQQPSVQTSTAGNIASISQTTGNSGVSIPVAEPAVNRAVENERWVLFQTPTKFTVQLATSKERGYIIDLAQSLAAEDPVAIYPFLTTNSQNPVFGLLSGLYDTRADAIAAVDRMASDTKQFGVWIRPIGDLQDAIKKQR